MSRRNSVIWGSIFVIVLAGCQAKDPLVGRNRPNLKSNKLSDLQYNGATSSDYIYSLAYRVREIRTLVETGLRPQAALKSPARCAELVSQRTDGNRRVLLLATDVCSLSRLQNRSDLVLYSSGSERFESTLLSGRPDVAFSMLYSTVGDLHVWGEMNPKVSARSLRLDEGRQLALDLIGEPGVGADAPLNYQFKYAVKIASHQELSDRAIKAYEDGEQWIDIDGQLTVQSGHIVQLIVGRAEVLARAPRDVETRQRKKSDRVSDRTQFQLHMILAAPTQGEGKKKVTQPLAFDNAECGNVRGELAVVAFETLNPNDRLKGRGQTTVGLSADGVAVNGKVQRRWYQCVPKVAISTPWLKIKTPAASSIDEQNRLANWNPYTAIYFK